MADPASERSFQTLLEPHRRAITVHCYRLLGSIQDAEEVVQESLLRAWQRQAELRSEGATRSWLYKIATNASLDLLRTRRRRALPHLLSPSTTGAKPLGPASDELHWVEPAPDALLDVADDPVRQPDARVSLRESVGLAFVTALQFLSPKQRAALLLVDVLGWRPDETASILETSVSSVNSLLQRARKSVEAHREDEASVKASAAADAEAVRRYIAIWESGDLDAFIALLAEDARLSMPPQPEWFEGREAIRQFLASALAKQARRSRFITVGANGRPAVAIYSRPPTGNAVYEAAGIVLFATRRALITEVTRFMSPGLFVRFGLPPFLPDGAVV